MTTLIKQRTPFDCSICTIAMATGYSYETVHTAAIKACAFKPDRGMTSEHDTLEALGLVDDVHFQSRHRGVLSPEFFRGLAWGRRAIMAVPSLNIEGGFHSVYWDGRELRDPCALNTYEHFNQLMPDEIVYFAERGAQLLGKP